MKHLLWFLYTVYFIQRIWLIIPFCQNRFWTSCVDPAIWIKFGIEYDLRRIIWVVISSKIASPKCALMYLKATLPKAWQWRNAIQKLQTKDFCLISKLWKHNKIHLHEYLYRVSESCFLLPQKPPKSRFLTEFFLSLFVSHISLKLKEFCEKSDLKKFKLCNFGDFCEKKRCFHFVFNQNCLDSFWFLNNFEKIGFWKEST